MESQKDMLIMGIGNLLMGDEGVGIHFVHQLECQPWLKDDVEIVDGGTGGFHLMEYFESYPNVILVDATMDGLPSGLISLITPRFASDFPRAMSSHDIGLRDLVEGLTILGRLPNIYLFTVSIEKIQPQCIELSPEIAAALPALEAHIADLVTRLRRERHVPELKLDLEPLGSKPILSC